MFISLALREPHCVDLWLRTWRVFDWIRRLEVVYTRESIIKQVIEAIKCFDPWVDSSVHMIVLIKLMNTLNYGISLRYAKCLALYVDLVIKELSWWLVA